MMRLKELRISRRLTQQNVADAIYCTPSTYARYERGVRNINIDILKKLSKYFETTVDYIIGND